MGRILNSFLFPSVFYQVFLYLKRVPVNSSAQKPNISDSEAVGENDDDDAVEDPDFFRLYMNNGSYSWL